jgi:hypothetical protein
MNVLVDTAAVFTIKQVGEGASLCLFTAARTRVPNLGSISESLGDNFSRLLRHTKWLKGTVSIHLTKTRL